MKKLIGLISLLGFVPSTFASIYIAAYTPPAPPNGTYTTKVTSVLIGQAHEDDSDTILPGKHSIYVKTKNSTEGELLIAFTGEDAQNGLALISTIGKNINITIEKDKKNKLVVQNLEFQE